MFIDTHTHLYTEEFDADREEVVRRATESGAKHLILPNIDEMSLPNMLALCKDYPQLCHPCIGLHPTELPANPKPTLDRMEKMLEDTDHPFVAIGEVGIDLYWDSSRRDEQIEVLQRQAEWAVRYGLPIIIHTRSAHREIVDTLIPFADKLAGGIFHCFGGTEEEARELLTLFPRFLLGIGGVVTFKKSSLPETLRNAVPTERIVVETDAPYLAPTPHRGRRNEPAFIPLIIQKLAETYDITYAAMEQQTTANAEKLFNLN